MHLIYLTLKIIEEKVRFSQKTSFWNHQKPQIQPNSRKTKKKERETYYSQKIKFQILLENYLYFLNINLNVNCFL